MATHIGPNIKIAGRVVGDDDLFVEGTIEGHIDLAASLVIAPMGFVTGDVTVQSVRVEGRFEGRLVADHIHLASTARVDAESLNAGLLQIDDGAKVRAEISMEIEASKKPVATKAPASLPAARPSAVRTTVQSVAPSAKAPNAKTETARATAKTTVTVVEEVEEVEVAEDQVSVDMSEYDAMTVKELRDRLKSLDLPISGTKPELAERLAEAES